MAWRCIDAYPQTGYDYRVRSMRTVDGTRYYSGWIYTSIKHWDWQEKRRNRSRGRYQNVGAQAKNAAGESARRNSPNISP